ncbi:MAG: 16S rRNA (cytidine(1402)-2'-O)-methyltransferase [Patescibacteria group bacterium]|jgi:16S rRNA (cytidine1402-2'-O)-methyltransferase
MAKLRLVATPIGNLEDITIRALRILKESDFILCEDTRVTKKLLDHYQISTPTISYHQHSGDLKIDKIISLLKEGKNLALVTDAGTPGVSDPGGKLVSLVRQELGPAILIESVPGVSALTAAVSLAGVGFDRFLFLGFLPHKKGRQTGLKEIMASAQPVILYESKHRIIKLLQELETFRGETNLEIMIARELTKLHESFYSGSPTSVLKEIMKEAHNLKGEFVVLIRKL